MFSIKNETLIKLCKFYDTLRFTLSNWNVLMQNKTDSNNNNFDNSKSNKNDDGNINNYNDNNNSNNNNDNNNNDNNNK